MDVELRTYKRKKAWVWPEWLSNALFAAFLFTLCVGLIWMVIWAGEEGREECPSCEKSIRPKVYHDMETGISHWKCTKCWFPLRQKKPVTEVEEESTTNGVQ